MVLAVAWARGSRSRPAAVTSSPETPIVVSRPDDRRRRDALAKTEFIAQADSVCAGGEHLDRAVRRRRPGCDRGRPDRRSSARASSTTIKQLEPAERRPRPRRSSSSAMSDAGRRRREDRPRRPARRGPEPVRDRARQRQGRGRRPAGSAYGFKQCGAAISSSSTSSSEQLQFQRLQLEQRRHGSPSHTQHPAPPAAPAAAAPAAAAPPAAPGRAARAVAAPPEALAAPAVSARVSQAGGYAAASSAQVP